jgi:hypothetical protein
MRKHIIWAALLFFLCIGFQAAFSADSLWVRSAGAELKADPGASGETVALLPIGLPLNVLDYKNRWYRVSTESGKKGWIYRGKVTDIPPKSDQDGDSDDGVGDILVGLSGGGIGVDEASADRGIRGLNREAKTVSPEAKEYADSTNLDAAYENALKSILNRAIQAKDIEYFLKTGHIGEYAQ